MYRRICGLMFVLLIAVQCFAIDFDRIRGRFINDSTGLDTSAYVAVLGRMLRSEMDSYEVHRVIYAQDSSASELAKMIECKSNAREIINENLLLSGADSAEIVDISEDNDFNLIWGVLFVPVAAGLEGIRRWRAKRKAAKDLKEIDDIFSGESK